MAPNPMNEYWLESKIDRSDDVFEMLTNFFEGCDEAEYQRRSAKLILLLVNCLEDLDMLSASIKIVNEMTAVSNIPNNENCLRD